MEVGAVLRGEADAASIFRNTTDIGLSRERVYAQFLRNHLPSKCNVFFGGFVFNLAGDESKQIDLLVTTDTCPRFDFHNPNGSGKAFTCVDGLLAAICMKSTLDSNELIDSLQNIASLPTKNSLDGKTPLGVRISNYDDWPFKIVYASDGISVNTLKNTLESFYQDNPHIPFNSRPNLIHVAGKYNAIRIGPGGGRTRDGMPLQEHTYHWMLNNIKDNVSSDVHALAVAVHDIQARAVASNHICFNYDNIINSIPFM
jgi:hypothetical protein